MKFTPYSAWSLRLLNTAYSGACLTARRDSDNTTTDIGFVDNYIMDIASFNAFIGAGSGYCQILFDQFGSNNISQSTLSLQPLISPSGGSFSRPTLQFDGTDDYLQNNLIASIFTGTDVEFSFCILLQDTTSGDTASAFAAAQTGSSINISALATQPTNDYTMFRSDSVGSTDSAVFGSFTPGNYHIIAGLHSGNLWHLFVDQQHFTPSFVSLAAINPDNFSLGIVISPSPVFPLSGSISEFYLWDRNIGDSELSNLIQNMNYFYGVY
ncbi:MAG: hypothetical protein ACE5FF_03345 [Saprospiraceae bacterium]